MRTKKRIDGRTKQGRKLKLLKAAATKKAKKITRRGRRPNQVPIEITVKRRSKHPILAPFKAKEERPWFVGKPFVSALLEDHSDDRGRFVTIENVTSFQHPIGAVAVVTRKAGSVFAEHRHAREGHTCMLVSGKAVYHERNATGRLAPLAMMPFVPVFTPPDVDHAFEVLEDLTMVVVANISRTQAEYEADVTRLVDNDRLVPARPRVVEEVPVAEAQA